MILLLFLLLIILLLFILDMNIFLSDLMLLLFVLLLLSLINGELVNLMNAFFPELLFVGFNLLFLMLVVLLLLISNLFFHSLFLILILLLILLLGSFDSCFRIKEASRLTGNVARFGYGILASKRSNDSDLTEIRLVLISLSSHILDFFVIYSGWSLL